jgi:hypothetical protein
MGEKPSVNFLIQAGMVSLGKRFKNSRGRRFSSQEVVAAINPFIILRASLLLAEMPGRLSCAGRRETTQRVGTQRARDRPDTGSQDRRFPCAEIKNSLYNQWGLTDTLSADALFSIVSDPSKRQLTNR